MESNGGDPHRRVQEPSLLPPYHSAHGSAEQRASLCRTLSAARPACCTRVLRSSGTNLRRIWFAGHPKLAATMVVAMQRRVKGKTNVSSK
ncbi:hypothetical protein ACCUM_1362 [Candidatus Accumulibacter phosphatis]|uniref:Uncharacterized protein n=1 Tax=Candidatus Accumulibacter phosphatis TaxID=327160 RepID=A0A5S4EJ66_9PROT|nr:hypothetical protein ACCUM_1362 [Candidatus Accumulibacter phosphatis]